ncbi:hypothetical protein N7539_002095 [Penicillium diatomitis]|uniref:Uncharacterized protein n=1 Tax=Penicillium diatomitis TaxID=2819901 RepID=A0A9W9XI63_9EURO|nr:uncharacterized protein N7539_002095 [Penicillium diatomitis]KAJ5493349.1 hypothetical protein N7539_002095 [Penicillium diatomitis]
MGDGRMYEALSVGLVRVVGALAPIWQSGGVRPPQDHCQQAVVVNAFNPGSFQTKLPDMMHLPEVLDSAMIYSGTFVPRSSMDGAAFDRIFYSRSPIGYLASSPALEPAVASGSDLSCTGNPASLKLVQEKMESSRVGKYFDLTIL